MLPLESEILLFRIKGGIELDRAISKTDEEGIKAGLTEAINNLIVKVNSNALVVSGLGGSLYLWPKNYRSTRQYELPEDAHCKAILKFVTVEINDDIKKLSKKKSTNIIPVKVINLQIMFELTRLDVIESVTVQHNTKSCIYFKLTLPVDVVILANPDDPWGNLQNQIVEAVSTQLSEMKKCIQRYTKEMSVPIPQAFHFELPDKTTLTTVIYPAGISEETLETQRKELHTELGLGDMPFLRRPMAFDFPNDELKNKHVKNLHKYISLPSSDMFKIHMSHGSYSYQHLSDNGWNAAFRCLQTTISWFNFQGYINIPIPTLEDMQRMLTSLDKTSEGVVTLDWFGSVTFSEVLTSLGISTASMNIQPAPDTSMDSSHLIAHFENHGTPIVIYAVQIGNVEEAAEAPEVIEPKAYMLLGVAVSAVSDDRKFLILDAQCTASDDLVSMVEKAIEWKSNEFWEQSELFELCLPQRPDGV
uniref:ufm1-specific protease 2-like n=1 Tax=Pristiophorus japonicus TaxID=55135 RepID=UPI00398ED375